MSGAHLHTFGRGLVAIAMAYWFLLFTPLQDRSISMTGRLRMSVRNWPSSRRN